MTSVRGFTVLFTGLSGAGKSTLARLLAERLAQCGRRDATVLDGDEVRRRLSPELGFSRDDRRRHVERLGEVAEEVVGRGGIAICAAIVPYEELRRALRRATETAGGFVVVYVATPLDVCERRDPKGLYKRARAGEIANFTGISDTYEPPHHADVTIDTTDVDADTAVEAIVRHLDGRGLLTSHA